MLLMPACHAMLPLGERCPYNHREWRVKSREGFFCTESQTEHQSLSLISKGDKAHFFSYDLFQNKKAGRKVKN